MATNDFLTIAATGGGSANVLTQAQYAALTTLLANGYQAGTASSAQMNKTWRQSSIMSKVIGDLIANVTGQNVVDDGTTATILSNLMASIMRAGYVDDTGVADAYVATLTPAVLAYYDGMLVGFSTVNANTTTNPTLNVNGLGAITITQPGGGALLPGQIPANTVVWLAYNSTGPRFELQTENVASAIQTMRNSTSQGGGTADAIAATYVPAITTLTDGMILRVRAVSANTSATPTFTPNSGTVAAKTIVKGANSALNAGDIAGAGHWLTLEYDLALDKWVLQNPAYAVSIPAPNVPVVRQTVMQGVTNSSGYANMLSAGAGLALNLSATAKAMRIAFAAGELDYVSKLSTDVTGVVSGLAANNLSYITADYVNPTSVAWGKTLAPPQYGYAYPRANQALLHFDGTAGATTMIDDYGNTWTAQGGAKLQTNQTKFGTAGLGGGGTNNALNGTTDYIKTTDITSLGSGSWSIRGWVYNTAWSATASTFANFGNASNNAGAMFGYNSGGKTLLYLSSDGSTWNLANASVGTATAALNTWNYIELTYDSVAGKYFLYLNGTVDQTVTSASRICATTAAAIGAQLTAPANTFTQGYIDEFEFLPYCEHPNGTTYAVPTGAPSVATAGYSSDFFSIPDMTMYKVTAASASAGTPPTLSSVNRVYVGEAVTGAATVSSVVNYALNGRYDYLTSATLTAGTPYSFNHNIGVQDLVVSKYLQCRTAELGYSIGDRASWVDISAFSTQVATSNKTITVTTGSSGVAAANKSTGNQATSFTLANWSLGGTVLRGF